MDGRIRERPLGGSRCCDRRFRICDQLDFHVIFGMLKTRIYSNFSNDTTLYSQSYLIDTYLMYSASAFAANTTIRSLVAAAFPLFTVQMYTRLGINWASTLVGLIGLVMAPSPFLFYKYGARIRQKSKFAPCIDLKIAKELEEEERQKAMKVEQV